MYTFLLTCMTIVFNYIRRSFLPRYSSKIDVILHNSNPFTLDNQKNSRLAPRTTRVSRTGVRLGEPEAGAPKHGGRGGAGSTF